MSASGPDARVATAGEVLTLERVVEYELDANGQVVDVATESENIRAVVSNPREEDQQRVDGRLSTGALRLTVPSGTDVQADRGGVRDRIYRPGRTGYGESYGSVYGGIETSERSYEVVEVRDDRHPITDTRKVTVLVDEIEGHGWSVEDQF